MRIFKITQQHCQNNSSHWEGHKKKDVYSPQLHLLWSYFQRDLVLGESVAITGNSVFTTFIQMRKDLGIKIKRWDFFLTKQMHLSQMLPLLWRRKML